MNDPDPKRPDVLNAVERHAARLNPGLCAVVLVLTTLVAAKATTFLPALYDEAIVAQTAPMTTDTTALGPVASPSE